jgi:collagenase-like PrtC family protease
MEKEIMLNFYLPDFFYLFKLNFNTIQYIKKNPAFFYDNINIKAVYGAFPPSIWNGGRTMSFDFVERDVIKATINNFNDMGVALRFTFTNTLLTEEHMYDSYCNECMKSGNNGLNEVLVNSSILEKYIRENYPKYKIISSTTKGIKTIDGLNSELEKYPIVVADYTLNNKEDLFNIPDRGRCEILLNTYCADDCRHRQEHYRFLAKVQLQQEVEPFQCPHGRDQVLTNNIYDIMKINKSFVTVEDLYGKYVPAGFREFKIEGRKLNQYEVIEYYIYYLVKPEYRDKVRVDLMFAITK